VSCCRVEALQLEYGERHDTALALYLVVAWRINRLMRLGRALPQLPADVLLHDDYRLDHRVLIG
jgi:hypothetical protein